MASYTHDTLGTVSTPLPLSSLPEYHGFLVHILDNLFTAEECTTLLSRASTSNLQWQPTDPLQATSGFRRLHRIVYNDPILAETVYNAVKNFLPDEIGPESEWVQVTGRTHQNWSSARAETGYWKLEGGRERLRFMRYGEGDYHGPHCDILYEASPGAQGTNDGQVKSFISALVFLNDDFEGGSLRFWGADRREFVEVTPRVGRVVLYQQRMLLHSGEVVGRGEKVTLRVDVNYRRVVVSREERKRRAEERGEMWVDEMEIVA